MIFLDTGDHFFVAHSRRELIDALFAHLPQEPDDETLAWFAAACLGCEPMDVVVKEQ